MKLAAGVVLFDLGVREMASVGHSEAQSPHPRHRSRFMVAFSSAKERASIGHISSGLKSFFNNCNSTPDPVLG